MSHHCRKRCPECRSVCRAAHPYGQVYNVVLMPDRVNEYGYPQVQHGHKTGWTHRTGFHIHAWWERPTKKVKA